MKKFTVFILLSILCGFIQNTNAQQYIKIDASFYSPVLDEVKKIDIYLPGDYYENPEQEYATIYYLHGGGANQNEGSDNAMYYYNLHGQDPEITSPPAIFVCPNGACQPYVGSMYVNSELYGNYEDYIMQDVIRFVESNFRAMPDKNFRMITGFSMGGFGSASLASKYPEKFRACIPMSGGFSMDTLLNNFRAKCYQEQGTYNLHYPAGYYTAVFFTLCGGYSPNMDIEPYHIEIPFDTLGNWQDTVINKWSQHEVIRRVKNLPDENELAWFLICGRQDNLAFFPSHKEFTDSLDFYGIGYDTSYFEGTHEFNLESWITATHWLDSIINLSYTLDTVSIIIQQPFEQLSIYPNPVSNQVKISYQLNDASSVKIDLFDQQGRKMKELMNCYQQIGSLQHEWNISSIPSGIYYLRLQTDKNILTRKIIKVN